MQSVASDMKTITLTAPLKRLGNAAVEIQQNHGSYRIINLTWWFHGDRMVMMYVVYTYCINYIMYRYLYMHIHIYIYTYIYVDMCISIHMFTYMYIYIYYIHTSTYGG